MDIEVNQTVGEGDEEEEEGEKEKEGVKEKEAKKIQGPEEELENALEAYRSADVARIHLEIHNLITQQNETLSGSILYRVELEKIDEYIAKVNEIAKRKLAIDKKAQGVKKRFGVVVEALRKKFFK